MNKEQTMEIDNTKFLNLRLNMYFFFKRVSDVLISLIGVIGLLVLTVIIKIVYMLTGDFKSIFYSHERIGKDGKPFKLYKYRTMVPNSAEMLEEMLKDKSI